jgi:pimeloyl-ACP methyl ester carboxylesterase
MRKRELIALTLVALAAGAARAAAGSNCLPDGTQESGAAYRICMPDAGHWNGDLVLYAHGYVAFNKPLGIPEDQLILPDGTSVPGLINGLGFAFATSGYSKNGLAVREGVDDIVDLTSVFANAIGQPQHVYLVGPSEGGLVTALSVERHPDVFTGGLAACGPIGDFRAQINYVGDFRVVFDFFFPGLIPGTPDDIPDAVIQNWDAVYVPQIKAAIAANPHRISQLLRVTHAPVGTDPSTVAKTVVDVLWYNVFGTNDAKAELGGQPYDNTRRFYVGSDNDLLLNLFVRRLAAEASALTEIQEVYQTTGELEQPLVTLHTTGDPIIPYSHERLYALKTLLAGSAALRRNIPVMRYGHCQFTAAEVVFGFFVLLAQSQGESIAVDGILPDAASRQQFDSLVRQRGLTPP